MLACVFVCLCVRASPCVHMCLCETCACASKHAVLCGKLSMCHDVIVKLFVQAPIPVNNVHSHDALEPAFRFHLSMKPTWLLEIFCCHKHITAYSDPTLTSTLYYFIYGLRA